MPKSKGDTTNPNWFKSEYNTLSEMESLRGDLEKAIAETNNDDIKKMARLLLKNTCTSPVAQNLKVFMKMYPRSIYREDLVEFLDSYRDKDSSELRKGFSVVGKQDPTKKVNKRFNQRG